MRKVMVMLGAMTLVGSMLAAGPAAAQEPPGERELAVDKIVVGESDEGFLIEVECDFLEAQVVESWDLPYLPDGSPDPDAPAETLDDWEIVDGSWVFATQDLQPILCTAIEIEDGDADSVTYACEYFQAEATGDEDFGDPCEGTDLDMLASVLFPAGPFGIDQCPTAGPVSPECVDAAVLTVTNTFDEPEPDPVPELELDPEFEPELDLELELDDISAVTATPTFTG